MIKSSIGFFASSTAAVGMTVGMMAVMPPAVAQTESGFGLEEVVVTARKREENLQNTPISISAYTGNDLKTRQISSTSDLSDVTPNLTFDPVAPSSGLNNSSQIFIRGIGQVDFTLVTDPGVGLYIDDVYFSRSVGGILDFLEVDRIEVLRGPQGTLFGRNTIGGAIVVHSRRPGQELGGNLQVEVGSDDKIFVTGYADIPLGDTLKSNISFSRRARDGYVTRVFDGIDLGDDNTWAVRGALLFEPTSNFEAYLVADYQNENENGPPTVSGGTNDLGLFAALENVVAPGCPITSAVPASARETNGDPDCANETSFLGPFSSGATFPTKSEYEAWGVSLTMTLEAAEWLTIKSITGYRDANAFSSRDADGSRFNILQPIDFWDHDQFSQELQFSGDVLNNRLQWLVGLYYFEEQGNNPDLVDLPVGDLLSGGLVDNDSKAIFGQATYAVTDKLALTFGIRRTEDSKGHTPNTFPVSGFNPAIPLTALPPPCRVPGTYCSPTGAIPVGQRILPFQEFRRDFEDTSLMANLAYQWTDNLMTYATYSEGFKSGGFDQRIVAPPINAATGLPTNEPPSFDPETVKSYEIGLKAQLFDNLVRLNVAAFTTDYENQQLIIRETFNPVTFNGGSSSIDGFEVEAVIVPTPQLIVTGSVGYLDASYDTLSARVLSFTPIRLTSKLVNTPEWSASVGVAYEIPLGWGALTPRLDWSYHGQQYNDAINSVQLIQESYQLLNGAINFVTNDERWEMSLNFRNITDELYLVTGNSAFGTSGSYVEQVYGRPFEWGFSVKYNF